MEELLVWIARGLVDEPDAVRLERVDEGDVVLLRLHVAPGDVGKVIGRQGRVVRAVQHRGAHPAIPLSSSPDQHRA